MINRKTYIVVPFQDAFTYWIERVTPFDDTDVVEELLGEDVMIDFFDRWITWLCGELLDGTDIQYMFHDTIQTAMRLTDFNIPFRRIDQHGDDLPPYRL